MSKPRELATLQTAVETYGIEAQVDMMIEEMSELTKALLKYRRAVDGQDSGDMIEACAEDIREEMADVQIMLNQMVLIFGDFGEQKLKKLRRLAMRLDLKF